DHHQEKENIKKWTALLESIEGFSIHKGEEPDPLPADNPVFQDIAHAHTDHNDSTPTQLWNRYIIVPGLSDLIIVDQRAAHERVIYETLLKDLSSQSPAVQKLLWPETIQSNVTEAALLREILPHLQYLGFDIAEFGHDSFIVHGIPAMMTDLISPQLAIEDILHRYREDQQLNSLKPIERIAAVIAFNLSRRRGESMTVEEMQHLIAQLMATENPYTSPSGRKTFITFGKEEIFRRFQS
ncbi:MAG TPA: hypothetical protein VFF90_09330, partial [Saprospiraceae bacterium]|nr:hypothetical protein [Saprospiraceae bacterium]